MMDSLSGVVPHEKPSVPLKPTIKSGENARPFEPLDERRQLRALQEYLCRLNEVRDWLVDCIGEDGIPKATDLEDHLRSGVILARIANYFEPNLVPLERIFDIDNVKYIQNGAPSYRHTDNIIAFRNAALSMRLPEVVVPETVDVYEGRNIRTIFCMYALAIRLFRQRKAPPIRNKFGTIQFTEEELESVKERFARFNQNFGNFSLGNLTVLCSNAKKSFSLPENGDEDAIIQSLITAISKKDAQAISAALTNCHTLCVDRNLIEDYIKIFLKEQDDLKENDAKLSAEDLRRIVHDVNVDYCLKRLAEYIRSQRQDLDEMSLILMELCGAEQVMEISLPLYRRVLIELFRERNGVQLSLDDVSALLETCNACIQVKIALLDEDRDELMDALRNPLLDVKFLNENFRDEYFCALLVAYEDDSDLYITQIQVVVENVNNTHVQLEETNQILCLFDLSANFMESPFLTILKELDSSMTEHLSSSEVPTIYLMHYLNELAALKDKSLLGVDDVRQIMKNRIEDFQFSTRKAIFAFRVNKAVANETDRELLAELQRFAAAFGLQVDLVLAQWYVSALHTALNGKFGKSGRPITIERASENCRYGRVIAVELKDGETMSIITKYVEGREDVGENETALTFGEIVSIIERANADFANHYEVVGAEKVRKCQREARRFVRKRRLKKRERAARVIQHAFRQRYQQKRLAEFDSGKLPSSLNGLRNFLLLKGVKVDYVQELEIERNRTRVKQLILENQRLNKDVTSLDKQIGFLVKNLIVHSREQLEANKVDGDDEADEASTSSFSKSPEKCQNEFLNHLEVLFYTLQMEPKYLTNLTNACMAKSRLSNPVEFYRRILLPIFNANSTTMRSNFGREEALMSHLFEKILSVYISKMDNIGEFMDEEQNRHNSIALTTLFRVMLRSFPNDLEANSTRMLDRLKAFVEDEPPNFNLNPSEIYQKIYGKAANNIDTALADTAVIDVLESSKSFALKWANRWASAVCDVKLSKCALNLLRVCADALEHRFPKSVNSSAELNRCTALFLYRIILNQLPDYIGELADGDGTTTTTTMRQMELLRAILTVLGIALSGHGFGDDASFLKSMNHELRAISERFSEYAANMTPSESPYPTAECLLASDKPFTLKIVLKDLQNILQLIVEHRHAVDADSKSSFQKLIDSVKYAWQVFEAKDDKCLMLTLHPSISEEEEDDEKTQPSMSSDELLIETKSAIVKLLLQSKDCSTIDELLKQSEEDGEDNSWNHLRKVAAENLNRMEGIEELRELVSNEHTLLLECIATDVRRQASEKHCRERSQLLASLQEAITRLESKRVGYTTQLEQYRNCLDNCIENMTLRRPAIVLTGENKQGEKEIRRRLEQPAVTSLKISGEKLLRKSLLAASTRSNVSLKELSKLSFEVTQTDETKKKWIFEVTIRKATKKSSKEDDIKVTLNLQDLLKAENEGRREFVLYPNVNLHPRNFRQYLMKKFYFKK